VASVLACMRTETSTCTERGTTTMESDATAVLSAWGRQGVEVFGVRLRLAATGTGRGHGGGGKGTC